MNTWPDVIPPVIAHLRTSLDLAPGRVATKIPAAVDTFDRFVRVARGPGSDDFVTDSFVVDAESFTLAAAPATSWPLAEGVRQAMHALGGHVVAGVLVDHVTTATAPVELDYGNSKVVRLVASYRLHLRKRA